MEKGEREGEEEGRGKGLEGQREIAVSIALGEEALGRIEKSIWLMTLCWPLLSYEIEECTSLLRE